VSSLKLRPDRILFGASSQKLRPDLTGQLDFEENLAQFLILSYPVKIINMWIVKADIIIYFAVFPYVFKGTNRPD
jgi:hypothetical protein